MFSKKKKPKKLYPENNPNPNSSISPTSDFIMPSIVNWSGNSSKDMSPLFPPPPKTPSPTSKYPSIIPTTPDTVYPWIPSTIPSIPNTHSIDHPLPLPKTNKRTREENNDDQSSSKIPRIESNSPPIYPSEQPPQISLSDISSTVLEKDLEDIDDIINRPSPPSSPKPIDINNLEAYVNLANITTEDWLDIESFIQPTPPPSLADITFSAPPTLDDLIFLDNPPPPIPIDKSKSVYKTIFNTGEKADLSSTPLIIPPIDTIYPSIPNPSTPPPPVLSPEKLDTLNASAPSTEMCSASMLESLKPRYKSKKGEKAPKKPTTAKSYTEDKTSNLTSNQLFDLLVYLSNCARDRVFLNKNIFLNIPNIQPLLDKYNSTILPMIEYNPNKYQTISLSHMKTAYRQVGTFLKQTYISIYPAEKILGLIDSNPESLNCIWILEYEEELRHQLQKIKNKISIFRSKPATKPATVQKRVLEMSALISALRIEFKKIYNLE